MNKLIITRGLPASGKTSWARTWIAGDTAKRARVNRDDLRLSLYGAEGVLPFAQEQVITRVQQDNARTLLAAGMDVVVDDTNLRLKFARGWADFAAANGAAFVVNDTFLAVDVDECVRRDYARQQAGGRGVGEDVIRSINAKFRPDRGLPDVTPTEVEDASGGYTYTPDVSLPSAVMVDIDGTVALMSGRGPYDFTQYHTDVVNEPVAQLVRDLYGADEKIIYCSGRDDTYYEETQAWLEANGLWWEQFDSDGKPGCELHMRPNAREPKKGNKRNDAVVKVELFREHIAPRFNVRFVLDDRDRVVKAWRAIGLTALQVADGAF